MLTSHRVADIRAAESALAAALPPGELMRRAAVGLANALAFVPPGEVVLMLVGPGDNGGDALFAATHLLDRGVRVDVCLLDEARVHTAGLAAATAAGARVVDAPGTHVHVVDAVFGIGARPGLTGRAAQWAAWLEDNRPWTLAVDVPSGVGVDTGTLDGPHVSADATVTFGTFKNALLAGPAADVARSGGVDLPDLVDIGLAPYLPRPALEAFEPRDGHRLLEIFDWLTDPSGHKYSRGVVGIAAGSEQYAGAAHLCVAGAQAGLAGMVRFVGAQSLAARVVDRAPEVVAGRGRVQAWVVGPGGGDDAGDQLRAALDDGVPLVVDAAALQHVPDSLGVPALLTPHAGELAAMTGARREDIEADPLTHVTRAAETWQATVLLKGRRTLVACPGLPTRVNLSGSPWLATAGSGDVLAGFAGSLLAAGAHPHDAGSLAAFLCGAASVRANRGGPVTATMVADALPTVVAEFHDGVLADVRDWRD